MRDKEALRQAQTDCAEAMRATKEQRRREQTAVQRHGNEIVQRRKVEQKRAAARQSTQRQLLTSLAQAFPHLQPDLFDLHGRLRMSTRIVGKRRRSRIDCLDWHIELTLADTSRYPFPVLLLLFDDGHKKRSIERDAAVAAVCDREEISDDQLVGALWRSDNPRGYDAIRRNFKAFTGNVSNLH